jgi:hypothetical protein
VSTVFPTPVSVPVMKRIRVICRGIEADRRAEFELCAAFSNQ